MRTKHIMAFLSLIAILSAYGSTAALAQNASPGSVGSITTAINATALYINSINQSSYLIFYPNLTGAYNYLNMARNESAVNSAYAYTLLSKARDSAQSQKDAISRYRSVSLYVLIVISVFLSILLYRLMKPYKRYRK